MNSVRAVWAIKAVDVIPELDGYQDVVSRIPWFIAFYGPDEKIKIVSGETNIAFDPEGFKPFSELSADVLSDWIKTRIDYDAILAGMRAHFFGVEKIVAEAIAPATVMEQVTSAVVDAPEGESNPMTDVLDNPEDSQAETPPVSEVPAELPVDIPTPVVVEPIDEVVETPVVMDPAPAEVPALQSEEEPVAVEPAPVVVDPIVEEPAPTPVPQDPAPEIVNEVPEQAPAPEPEVVVPEVVAAEPAPEPVNPLPSEPEPVPVVSAPEPEVVVDAPAVSDPVAMEPASEPAPEVLPPASVDLVPEVINEAPAAIVEEAVLQPVESVVVEVAAPQEPEAIAVDEPNKPEAVSPELEAQPVPVVEASAPEQIVNEEPKP